MTDLAQQLHDIPKLVVWPNTQLNIVCQPVEDVNAIKQTIRDMFTAMRYHKGIGLAAPQIGHNIRVFVMEIGKESRVFINPEIVSSSTDVLTWEEGCLSVPGYFETRNRPNKIIMKHQAADGTEHEVELVGIWAFAAQHEIDHLDGKMFVDGMSQLKTSRIRKKINKTLKRRGI